MGMNTRGGGGSNKTYLGIYANELVLEYAKREELEAKLEALGLDPEKIQVRQKTKGKNEGQDVFYYIIYDIEGLMTNVSINETDWGDFVEIEITDVDEKFVVSLGDVFSRTSKDFIRRIHNIDLDNYINFAVWSMTAEETGRSAKSGVKMYQNDVKVDYSVSYDDMPQPEEKKKGRKTEWDYTEQETYLYDQLVAWLDENFKTEGKDEAPAQEQKKDTPKPPRKTRGNAVAPASADGSDMKPNDLPW